MDWNPMKCQQRILANMDLSCLPSPATAHVFPLKVMFEVAGPKRTTSHVACPPPGGAVFRSRSWQSLSNFSLHQKHYWQKTETYFAHFTFSLHHPRPHFFVAAAATVVVLVHLSPIASSISFFEVSRVCQEKGIREHPWIKPQTFPVFHLWVTNSNSFF